MTVTETPRSASPGRLRRRRPQRRHHRPSAQRSIPVRRLGVNAADVDFGDGIVPGDPHFSHLLAVLSAVFPNGEDFFVASVRAHRAAVADDPVLMAQVNAFIGQEAMHGREHRALNEVLAGQGYNTVRADRTIKAILDRVIDWPPATLPIAVTAAAEHYTGLLGEAVLGDDSTRRTLFGRPGVEELISWHALEELEHKNVAFDVMQRVGTGYPVRAAGFAITTLVLAGYVTLEWGRSLWAVRGEITAADRRRFLRDLRRQRLLSPWFAARAAAYLRPGFHPDDTDTDELVAEWRERLAPIATPVADRRPAG